MDGGLFRGKAPDFEAARVSVPFILVLVVAGVRQQVPANDRRL
jgi:hypothetical protein